MAPLDNAVWHALAGPQAAFAVREGCAVRFRPDVSPFLALPDEPDEASWHDLARLLGPAGTGALFRRHTPSLPDGWTELERFDGVQLVAADPTAVRAHAPRASDGVDIVVLGPDDVGDMLDLVARTAPGPFEARTHELGRYVGIRLDGRLVAMAGERMRLAGGTEVSAVCTDEAHRGRGFAARLVAEVARGIVARGETPFLHVLADNHGAIRVYESLGFERRASIGAVVVRAPRATPAGLAAP
jgi:ribosomal protein S18 acetylase RimI-like enzyme